MSGPIGVFLRWTEIVCQCLNFKRIQVGGDRKRYKLRYALCISACFETHRHEDKFWNLWPMPSEAHLIAL